MRRDPGEYPSNRETFCPFTSANSGRPPLARRQLRKKGGCPPLPARFLKPAVPQAAFNILFSPLGSPKNSMPQFLAVRSRTENCIREPQPAGRTAGQRTGRVPQAPLTQSNHTFCAFQQIENRRFLQMPCFPLRLASLLKCMQMAPWPVKAGPQTLMKRNHPKA